MKRRIRILLLALLLVFPLSACRESPVLHEVRYEQAAPQVDEEQEMLDPENEGERDEQFDNEKDENAETMRDSEAGMGLLDLEQPGAESSLDRLSAPAGGAPEEAESGEALDDGESVEMLPEAVPGGENAGKQIVDASGRAVTLPERAEHVTAVGWAAQMVEMLGGGGRLLAADQEFCASPLARAAFSDLSAVKALWTDGESPLSGEQFAALLALEPEVCFEISGENTFTDVQIRELEAHGVVYIVLPAPKGADALKQAAQLIAEVLDTHSGTGESAAAIAAQYAAWVDDTLRAADSALELTSLYIADWDDAASYVLDHTRGVVEPEGSGLAMAFAPQKAQPVSAFMKAAGVVNESTRIMSTHRDSEYVYVTPMFHQFDPVVSGTRAAYYSGAGEYGAAFDLFVARMVSAAVYYQLGGTQFPAVIAANETVKQKLEANWFWQFHESDASGYVTISGESFYCGVIGEYEIYVNPQGMCDWAQGSAESPLEACWVSCKFGGGLTLDQVKEKTGDFYARFFGLTLTESQLGDIFGE